MTWTGEIRSRSRELISVRVADKDGQTFEIEVASVYFLLESPQSGGSQETREEDEQEGSPEDADVAAGVEEPGSEGQRECVRPVPHHPQHCQPDHSVSGE